MANFDPIESKPLIVSVRGTPKPNLVHMHQVGASGQMGEI